MPDAIGNKTINSETYWGNPKTTEDMIKAVKAAGFNTIRIPVSWGNHMDSSNMIDTDWLNRVKTVVNYAIDNDMYVILNTHHEGNWLVPSVEKEKEITKKFTAMWKQIAEYFKGYDEHLIFEGWWTDAQSSAVTETPTFRDYTSQGSNCRPDPV